MAENADIVLRLTPQEVDKICSTLAQRPWIEVHTLLQKIVQQAQQVTAGQRQGVEPDSAVEPG